MHQAMKSLSTAGVELDGVQQMQLDRLRMQAELHEHGRLQQRYAALQAELQQHSAAAESTSSSSSTSSRSSTNSSNSSNISRGILIVAGSRDQMSNALVSIITLQQVLKCNLPIEVVYYGLKEYDPLTAKIIKQYSAANGGGRVRLIDGMRKQVRLVGHVVHAPSSGSRSHLLEAPVHAQQQMPLKGLVWQQPQLP
jgi:hypothetical protein